MLKKIVILGPESTGKSTLCELLAQHYQTEWCPEFAREYLLTNGTDYNYDDLLLIAKGQVAMEDEYANRQLAIGNEQPHLPLPTSHSPLATYHSPLFIDTDMYVMKVWCEFVFEKCHPLILDQINERKYDLYLLCNIDLPWTKDDLREYPEFSDRLRLYNMYKDILINQTVPWVEIIGNFEERLNTAINAVDKLIARE